ncbi:MAG TPA: FHA domain-containing protein, partial [Streptosporangiaceae bacterium]|nr:FHA domain-containing protein [Streptosporangiaceae bacterium]
MNTQASAPSLVVRTGEGERSLAAGRVYLVGRDPQADIVVADFRVSWHHAELRPARGRWALADLASSNGCYADGRRADLIEIDGTRQIRLGDPEDGPLLDCTLLTPTAGLARRIGRVPDNDIMVPHPSVSRHHAELHATPGGYRIVDLGSHNGTFVNEQRVSAATLAEGDTVGFGDTTFRLTGGELREITGLAQARMPPAADP